MRHILIFIAFITLLFSASSCDSGVNPTRVVDSVDTIFWEEPESAPDMSAAQIPPQESPTTEQSRASEHPPIDFHPANTSPSPSRSSSASRSESAYDLGYRNGYDNGYDDAINGEDPDESPRGGPYSSRHLISEYERGYRSGYYDGYHEAWDEAKEEGEDLEEW